MCIICTYTHNLYIHEYTYIHTNACLKKIKFYLNPLKKGEKLSLSFCSVYPIISTNTSGEES